MFKFSSLLFLVFFINYTKCEYLYPVANSGSTIYIINQRSLDELELWSIDLEDGYSEKILMSCYAPACFKLLPNNKAFSFIDNGRLRIKYFIKRSVKSVEWFYDVSDISLIEWENSDICYFSAKRLNQSCIFFANIKENTLKNIKFSNDSDFLYPQKIDSQLFYIDRKNRISNIVLNNLETGDENIVINCTPSKAAIFLKMLSANNGFYIEHSYSIDCNHLEFTCFKINLDNYKWKREKIFTFNLPLNLLIGSTEERFYESLLPFLPKYIQDKIYFCSSFDQKNQCNIDIYCFDLVSNKVTKKTNAFNGQIFCSPLVVKDKVFYGGSTIEGFNSLAYDEDDHTYKIKIPWFRNK